MAGEVIFAKLSQLEAFGTKVVTDFAALTARVQSLERAGGQPNIIEKILVNGIQLAVDGNKAVNFSVPTKTGELENDAGFQNGEDVDAKLEGKADSGHTHDDRYYTKAEDNGFLADKTGIVCSAKEPDARSILWLNTNWDGKQEDETQIMMLDIGDANGSAPVTVDIQGVIYSVENAEMNASLTKTSAAILSTARTGLAATTVGDYAIFSGGGVADFCDASLTRSSIGTSMTGDDMGAATIGDYALFAGGHSGDTNYDSVEVYTA